jgi:cyclohexanecarboxylate-CoA ligase
MSFDTLLTKEWIEKKQSYWPNKTIIDYLHECISKFPEKTAIVDKKSRYTYRELGKMVDRAALGLLELGLKKGDVISFQIPNWNEYIILHYAASRIGAISNALIPIYRDREIGFMVGMCESKLLVIPDHFRGFNYPEMVQKIQHQWPSLENVLVIGEDIPEGMISFSVLFDKPWEELRDPSILDEIELDPNDLTLIMFTSGTTGEPKGVMHTHNTLCTSSQYWVDHVKLTSDDVVFMASTFGHFTGLAYGARLPVHFGGTGVYQDIWNPNEFIELIEREKITVTAGATPFLQDSVQVPDIDNYDLSSFRVFVSSGAPIPRQLIRQASNKLNCKILAGWGQTEEGLITLTSLNDSDEKLVNSDGAPLPGVEVLIVDEDGNPVLPNTEGSLLCKAPTAFVGYLKRLELTLSEYDGEWFVTGDRALMDEDGHIRITGRNKDIIIRGGENIPVSYVENTLFEHPDIDIVQVVGMPDPRLQERACAFISLKEGVKSFTLEQMREYLSEKGMAKQYWPEHIEIVDEFPMTPSGKVQKFRLRQMITEKMSRDLTSIKE